MPATLITPPVGEPITLTEAKAHIKVTWSAEDDLITRLIAGARQAFEDDTGRQLLTATWEMYLDCFPRFRTERIEVCNPPLDSVTSITYIDTAGASQTWSNTLYTVKALAGPHAGRGQIYPVADETYPLTRRIPNAVSILFDAGYGAAAAVPEEIKEALLAWISHHYLHREEGGAGGRWFDTWKDKAFA